MIIHLSKSVLFTKDPDERFAETYRLPKGLWRLLYQRYDILEYSLSEVCELYQIKTGRLMSPVMAYRWIWRTKIYDKTAPLMKKGAETVVSDFFGEDEMKVIQELTKNLKTSVRKDTKALL